MDTKRIVESILYKEAVDYACTQDNISLSMLQREFRISYERASTLMEKLEEDGIVSRDSTSIPKVLGKKGSAKRELVERWKQLNTGFEESYNDITKKIIKTYCRDSEGKSVFSPLSIIVLLNMLAGATAGKTRTELEKLISENHKYDVAKEQIKAILNYLEIGDNLKIANAVCVDLALNPTLNPEYVEELNEYYSGQIIISENTARETNKWITEKTNGAIQRVLDDEDMSMAASLINAVAFDAKWQDAYEEDDIRDGHFTNADSSISIVPMLSSTERCYLEGDKYVGFVKNYRRGEFSFMGLLPKKKGWGNLRRCLDSIDLTKAFTSLLHEKVLVTMPEFNCSCNMNLVKLCEQFGVKEAFSYDADFSPMSSDWLKVDNMVHSARIEVDRKGTKAAAVTAVAVGYGCAPDFSETKIIELDRPFIYAIMHNASKLPIFVGVVNKL